mgnify:FL=1
MKVYKSKNDIIIEKEGSFRLIKDQDWDKFINDENLYKKLILVFKSGIHIDQIDFNKIDPPIKSQELWASGVTYFRSKQGRQQESKESGAGQFYDNVYNALRPEIFFKASASRIVGNYGNVRIRKDSDWNVPEPELTLVITSSGKIIGYTIGNDMTSRSIEGENPLYLPQAKTYDGCAAIGPCVYVSKGPLKKNLNIYLEIIRNGKEIFKEGITFDKMKRTSEELVQYLYRECSFPYGSLLMTGTGIVPPSNFTLQSKDEITISIDNIGSLVNTVE